MSNEEQMRTYQPDQKNIDWSVVNQGLSEDEMIIALSVTNGNYTVLSYCPTIDKLQRMIVFQWSPILIDYCRGCKQFHFEGNTRDMPHHSITRKKRSLWKCNDCGNPMGEEYFKCNCGKEFHISCGLSHTKEYTRTSISSSSE